MNFTSSPFERMMKEVPHPGWDNDDPCKGCRYYKAVSYTHLQDDDYNSVRCEYVEMLENQIAKSNNGIVRTKLLTFGVNVDCLLYTSRCV